MSSTVLGVLTEGEKSVEERLRTLAMCICALGVVGFTLHFLRQVLVPFVLAMALQQILAPLVDALVRPLICRCFHLPRFIAVVLTLLLAAAALSGLGLIVADSVRQFSARTGEYAAHVQSIFSGLFSWMDRYGFDSAVRLNKLKEIGDKLPITQMLLAIVENLLATVENVLLILLFSLYLLLGNGTSIPGGPSDKVGAQINSQIRSFIKGKVLLSLLVGFLTGFLLWTLRVDLWLCFGVLAFWLNFIPNVGALIAVAAPMPLVLFTPSFGLGKMMLSLMLPLLVHVVVGNVLEPVVFGRAMELQPVIVLLSLMVWGTLWGVPGLVLAVPLTAVLKIHLSYVDHPLPRLLLRVLEGEPRNRNAQGSSGGSSGGGNHQPGPMKHSDSEPDEDQELLPDLGISHAHHFPSRLSTTPPPASLEGISIDGNQQRMENACLVAGLDVEQPRGSRTR